MRASLAAIAAAAVLAPGAAYATFSRSSLISTFSASTVSISAVSGLAVTSACGPVLSLKAKATLVFAATTTARATALQVWRAPASGPYTAIATIAAGATTYVDSNLNTSTTYRYTVRTMVGSWYRETSPVSVTTPIVCT